MGPGGMMRPFGRIWSERNHLGLSEVGIEAADHPSTSAFSGSALGFVNCDLADLAAHPLPNPDPNPNPNKP